MERTKSREGSKFDPDVEAPTRRRPSEDSLLSAPYHVKAIIFIILVEFCERFNFYGVRANLPIFLQKAMGYNEAGTAPMIRRFVFFCYITPLLGAMVADSFVGKSVTIVYMLLFYLVNGIMMALMISLSPSGVAIVLVLMTISAGGMKPCLQVLGGDQYVQPQDYNKIRHFFCLYYMAINLAAVAAILLASLVRADIAIWSTAVMLSIAYLVFVCGRPSFKKALHKKSIGAKAVGCIFHALRQKAKSKEKREHWLEYASPKYTHQTMDDVRAMLQLFILFIPMPIFWALYFQQFSVWAEELRRTNRFWDERLITMQEMELINPLCIVIFAPILQFAIYPLLALGKLLRTPLPRIIIGGLLVCLAFVIAGVMATDLDAIPSTTLLEQFKPFQESKDLPADTYQARFFALNNYDMPITVTVSNPVLQSGKKKFTLDEGEWKDEVLTFEKCTDCEEKWEQKVRIKMKGKDVSVEEKKAVLVLNTTTGYIFQGFNICRWDVQNFERDDDGCPLVETIVNPQQQTSANIIFLHNGVKVLKIDSNNTSVIRFPFPATYSVKVEAASAGTITLKQRSRYLLALNMDWETFEVENVKLITLADNDCNIDFTDLLPQYIILALAETMFAISGMQFVYTQSPFSLKSLMQALFLLMIAVGMILEEVIISFVSMATDDLSTNFYICAGIMLLDVLVLILLTLRYKYMFSEAVLYFNRPREPSVLPTEGNERATSRVIRANSTGNKMN